MTRFSTTQDTILFVSCSCHDLTPLTLYLSLRPGFISHFPLTSFAILGAVELAQIPPTVKRVERASLWRILLIFKNIIDAEDSLIHPQLWTFLLSTQFLYALNVTEQLSQIAKILTQTANNLLPARLEYYLVITEDFTNLHVKQFYVTNCLSLWSYM